MIEGDKEAERVKGVSQTQRDSLRSEVREEGARKGLELNATKAASVSGFGVGKHSRKTERDEGREGGREM